MTTTTDQGFTFQRSGARTRVLLNGVCVAFITRKLGSDSSPRGGAYRTFHHLHMVDGGPAGHHYTRAEAVQVIQHRLTRATQERAARLEPHRDALAIIRYYTVELALAIEDGDTVRAAACASTISQAANSLDLGGLDACAFITHYDGRLDSGVVAFR